MSEYVNDCSGFQYFSDDADGQEYVYTDLEPANAHVWFPCFDQPDIKACHEFIVVAPSDWVVVSNCANLPNLGPKSNLSDDNKKQLSERIATFNDCLLYTSDAADE